MTASVLAEDSPCSNGYINGDEKYPPQRRKESLRFFIIGAGSRGHAYATALTQCASNTPIYIAGVAEPVPSKRKAFEQKYVRHGEQFHAFGTWQEYAGFEKTQRDRWPYGDSVSLAMDGVFVCVLDEMHAEVITALAPLGLNIMSEKPLATTLNDCLKISRSLQPPDMKSPQAIFSIGHVLRYSPHNMLLRKILLQERVIGDVLSIEHTEPVGWWHFSHSYVRGNWRKTSKTAPSLLTKSCHDIDLLLWFLCSPSEDQNNPPHLPTQVTSTGTLLYFKKARKPRLAGKATNCLNCPAERECLYSAKKIYDEGQLLRGNAGWPVNVIDPEIEDLMNSQQPNDARQLLLDRLSEDYNERMPQEEIDRRPWFGRCVYETGNDVCDDQVVTMMWEDDPLPLDSADAMGDQLRGRGSKIATFHMVASTEKQCERRGRIYGTKGEIEYDSKTIRVYDFTNKEVQIHTPPRPGGGHGGGDTGLAQQFVKAIEAVQINGMRVAEAQKTYIGCTIEDIIRSHAMVFAADEARREKKVVDWADWWQKNVESARRLRG